MFSSVRDVLSTVDEHSGLFDELFFQFVQIILSLRAETQHTFDAQQKIICELQERLRSEPAARDQTPLPRSRLF